MHCKLLCTLVACVNGKLLGKKPCLLISWEHWLGVGATL